MARMESFLDERRERLAASAAPVNGIAGIEVDPADMTRLQVQFVHPLPGETDGRPEGSPPAPADIVIDGGDRIRGLTVISAEAEGRELRLKLNRAGDFSTYTLRIHERLSGYDPVLRQINFGFRLNCERGDCSAEPEPVAEPAAFAQIDYLARDYESYRRMMLDRLAVTVPGWTERNPADIGVTLVEWLAYIGDALSYKLDHVATESTLDTARLRVSAARHARLVGYRMHNGASARVLAQVELAEGVSEFTLPATGVAFLTRIEGGAPAMLPLHQAQREVQLGAIAFEPLCSAVLRSAHAAIPLHHWGDREAVLRKGAVTCDIRDPDHVINLSAGGLLVLIQNRDPVTRRAQDADPQARQAVRLTHDPQLLEDPLEMVVPTGGGAARPLRVWRLQWGVADALHQDIACGAVDGEPMALALGNIVPASHGLTLTGTEEQPLLDLGAVAPDLTDPELPPAEGMADEVKPLAALDRPQPFSPRLSRKDLSFATPFDDGDGSAASLMRVDPEKAVAQISLRSELELDSWLPVPDLLGQPADALVFVAEVEDDGSTHLRFGRPNGGAISTSGRTPLPHDRFVATYRIGTGSDGNIGAGALAHIAASAAVSGNLAGVSNPLPAAGGVRRESIAEVRQRAPISFHRQQRAVTLADYEALLKAHPDVQRAVARKRWLGGWSAIFLTVDRKGGAPLDQAFRQMLLAYLEPYRMMGHDLAIDEPVLVPLFLGIRACASPDAFADKVQKALAQRFSAGLTEDGRRGFFHPDNLSFGSTVYLSHIYEAALQVPGVADVEVIAFNRAGNTDSTGTNAMSEGVLRFGPREIPLLANDPNRPGEGRLTIEVGGGR